MSDSADNMVLRVDLMRLNADGARLRLVVRSSERLRFLYEMMVKPSDRNPASPSLEDAVVKLRQSIESNPNAELRQVARLAALQLREELARLLHIRIPMPKSDATLQPIQGMPDTSESWRRFHITASTLPAEECDVFGMVWYLGLSVEEASFFIDMPYQHVSRLWQSARIRLAGAGTQAPTGDCELAKKSALRNPAARSPRSGQEQKLVQLCPYCYGRGLVPFTIIDDCEFGVEACSCSGGDEAVIRGILGLPVHRHNAARPTATAPQKSPACADSWSTEDILRNAG